MIDLKLTDDNDISFALVDGDNCLKQIIYHAIMTRYGELSRDPKYGNLLHKRRIKKFASGVNLMLTDCTDAIRLCSFVKAIDRADITTIDDGYRLTYTITTKDGTSLSDVLDIISNTTT